MLKEMLKEIKDMSITIHLFKVSLERQEQYSKRNCLLIHGLPESRSEITDQIVIETLNEMMWKKINVEDLDRTHRLRAPKEAKVRPIFVKLAR